MCGRFYLDVQQDQLREWFRLQGQQLPELTPRFNIAPSQAIAVVREGEQGRELAMLRWGLLPSWAKEEKSRFSMINARAETVAQKPAYRTAFRQRRCLIPASGFFEWKSGPQGKQPYLIRRKDGTPMAFAGIWERWQGTDKVIESCAMIVTEANADVAPIHERMPVMLAPDDFERWLSGGQDSVQLQDLLVPSVAGVLESFAISKAINRPDHDSVDLLRPLT